MPRRIFLKEEENHIYLWNIGKDVISSSPVVHNNEVIVIPNRRRHAAL